MPESSLINNSETQTEELDHSFQVLELESRITTQLVTIRTLKALLEQSKSENTMAHSRVPRVDEMKLSNNRVTDENRMASNGMIVIESDKRVKVLEASNIKLATEIERMNREKAVIDATVSSLKSKVRSTVKAKECAENQLGAMEEDLLGKEKHIRDLEHKLERANVEVDEAQARLRERDRLISHCVPSDKYEQDMACLRLEVEGVLASLESEQQRIQTLEIQNRELQSELCPLRPAIHDQKERIRVLLSKLDDTADELRKKSLLAESLEQELLQQRKAHRDEFKSLETSHSLAISLLEQTTATAMEQLDCQARISSEAMLVAQQRVNTLLKENTDLKSDLLKTKLLISTTSTVGVQCEVLSRSEGVITDSIRVAIKEVATDRTPSPQRLFEQIKKCITCNACDSGAVGILFPCGHGVCESCFESKSASDSNMRGVVCMRCKDNLPVTAVCRSRQIADIYALSRQFCSS